MKYKEMRLEEIANFKTGKLNANRAVANGKYPFFTTSPEILRINEYAYDENAILLGGNNANGVFQLKRYIGKFNAYQRTYIISSKNNHFVNNDYLFYALMPKLRELQNESLGTATKFITKSILNNLVIKVPENKKYMQKVAAYLKCIDSKISLNNKINANLLDFALSYFDSIQKEKFVKLQEILEVRDGTHDSPKQKSFGFPLVTSKAIKGNSIDFSQTKLISQNDFENINKRSKVETNDILVSMIGTVGIIYKVIEAPVDFAIKNVGLIKSGNHQELANIVYLHLISKAGQDYINSHLSGSTQQFISLTNLRNLPIPTLDNFTNIQIDSIKKIFLMITQNSKQNFILKKIKKELLSKFF